jgi:hypothetical protein
MESRMKRAIVVMILIPAILTVMPLPASADVGTAESTPASCMGIEAAALSPPGSSDEAPGGVPDVKAFLNEVAPGVPPGPAFFAFAARLHETSHEACDVALGG